MSTLVANERLKYGATALNNLGVALMVTGGLTPLAAYETGAVNFADQGRLIAWIVATIVLGVMLMGFAQLALQGLKED